MTPTARSDGAHPQSPQPTGCAEVTLLDLVRAVGEVTPDDQEVVATIVSMLRSGRVRLCGNFRGEHLDAA